MELEQVHKYIERYFEGETSLEEEQTLVAYFSQSEVAKSLCNTSLILLRLRNNAMNTL